MANTILNKLTDELLELDGQLSNFKQAVAYIADAKESVSTAVSAVHAAEAYHNSKLHQVENVYAKTNSIIESAENLSSTIAAVDFPARLANIDENLKRVIADLAQGVKATLTQVDQASTLIGNTDFDSKFKELQSSLHTGAERSNEAITGVKTLSKEQHSKLGVKVEELARYIKDIHVVNRFDGTDKLIKNLCADVQSIQNRIDELGKTLTEASSNFSMQQANHFSASNNSFAAVNNTLASINANIASLQSAQQADMKTQQTRFIITLVLIVIAIIAAFIAHKM